MKKRLLIFIFMMLTGIFQIIVGQENGIKFTSAPLLQNMTENSVYIFWEVNKTAKSRVEYGNSGKLEFSAQTANHGMVEIREGMQKVEIKGLLPGKEYYYRVVSIEVKSVEAYKVVYGDTVKSEIFKFKTPDLNKSSFNFLAFNDLHNIPGYLEDAAKREGDFEFALFNGDVITDLNDEKEFAKKIFAPVSAFFASEKPVYFIRGNHETRGAAARNLINYFAAPGGKFYYTFKRGNTFFIMLDCGEDKPDSNKYYFGLADYDNYRSEEAEWLKKVVASKEFRNATHRIVALHMPISLNPEKPSEEGHGVYDLSKKFSPILNNAGIDLMLSGHTHKYEIIRPGKGRFKFPIVVGGAYYDVKRPNRVAYTRVEVSPRRITALLKDINGVVLDKVEINK